MNWCAEGLERVDFIFNGMIFSELFEISMSLNAYAIGDTQ